MNIFARGLTRSAARAAVVAVVAAGMSIPAAAGVKYSTQYRSYSVGGTTSKSLVSYMRSRPFHGDRGNAVANIRPYYKLSVATKTSGGKCRASSVTLNIRFVMTLPKARSESSMASSTRNAWRGFVAFAKQHENTHKNIYVQCAHAFVAKAQRMSASSCVSLQASIRRQLETDKRSCESKQRAFDRRDSGRMSRLSLFRMAR
mgnify:CR=1 FL=1